MIRKLLALKHRFLIPLFIISIILGPSAFGQKPKVWIYTDMSDKSLSGPNKLRALNDPEDMAAMAGYLLMANHFETLGIVVSSTHRHQHKKSPNQAEWANQFFGQAYQKDLPQLNKHIGGFPDNITFMESCIKATAEKYDSDREYVNLFHYPTVRTLIDTAMKVKGPIFVLCWGSLTEPAILVKHCISTGKTGVLRKLRFIGHWTNSSWHQGSMENPDDVANCKEDSNACQYLKGLALDGVIKYYECGAIGQYGIVSGSPRGKDYFDQFRTSELGKIFVESKFVFQRVDHSDAATYWVLLGEWGVQLNDISSNGHNFPHIEQKNEASFKTWSPYIHQELLRRSKAAGER